jgi:hypothetical protein
MQRVKKICGIKKPMIQVQVIMVVILMVSIIVFLLHQKYNMNSTSLNYENTFSKNNEISSSKASNNNLADTFPEKTSKTLVESRSLPILSPKPHIYNLKSDFSNAIFIGDSITFGFTKANNTPIKKDHVYAKIGAHVFEGSELLGENNEVITKRCNGSVDYVFLMFGANDYGYDLKSYKAWYEELIEHIKKMFPDARIVLQSVMPMKGTAKEPQRALEPEKLNRIVKTIAIEENTKFINISESIPNVHNLLLADGLHFKPELYPLWLAVIKSNEKQISN